MSHISIAFQVKRSWGWETIGTAWNEDHADDAHFQFESKVGQGGIEFWPEIFSGRLIACPIPEDQRGTWPKGFRPAADANPDYDEYVCSAGEDCDDDDCEGPHERSFLEMGTPLGWVTLEQLRKFRWNICVAAVTLYAPLRDAQAVPFGEMPKGWWKTPPSYATVADDVAEGKRLEKEHPAVYVRFRGGMTFAELTEGAYPGALEAFEALLKAYKADELRLVIGEVGE